MDQRSPNRARLALLIAAALTGSLAVAPPASASARPAARDCVLRIESGTVTCFADFRAAIRSATGGRVTDAPVLAAPLDQATTARVDAAGAAAAGAAKRGASAAAAATVVGVEFRDFDYGGGSLTLTTGDGPCHDGTDYLLRSMPDGWNDQISSFQSFNNCYTTHYTDNDLSGQSMEWYANDRVGNVGSFNDQFSSIKFNRGPSRQELVNLCNNGSDTCDFHPETGVSESYRDFHEVGRLYNCTTIPQTRTLSWSDTAGGSITIGTEVSATAGFNVEALAKFEVTVKQTFSRQWSWSSTFTDSSPIAVGPLSWGALDRNPKLQSVGGYYELHFGSRWWGHYVWYVRDFVGTGPVPQDGGVTRIRGNAMTPAEISANCGHGVAAKAGVVRAVPVTHSIATGAPARSGTTPQPVHAG